jgi:SpoVK/Ycf46/Vps4 family AAA+-type ATPase
MTLLHRSLVPVAQGVFISGKPKKGGKPGDPPNRILKPLRELVEHKSDKKRLLDPTDRVLILGSSAAPYAVEKAKDAAGLLSFFTKVLYLPMPDYPSRYTLWQEALKRQGILRPPADDVQTLARISEHYASGSIMRVVRRSITQRRVDRIDRKPFSMNELIGPLSKEKPIYQEDDKAMVDWYLKTLGLDAKPEAAPKKAPPKKK